jgi:hypothetical protein
MAWSATSVWTAGKVAAMPSRPLIASLGITKKERLTAYPQTEGKIEYFHQTLKKMADWRTISWPISLGGGAQRPLLALLKCWQCHHLPWAGRDGPSWRRDPTARWTARAISSISLSVNRLFMSF